MHESSHSIMFIIKDTIRERLGIQMPQFNKGIFNNIEYEAKPIGKFRNVLNIFRIYKPYFPGDKINFSLSLKSINSESGGIKLEAHRLGGYDSEISPKKIDNYPYSPEKITHNVFGLEVYGSGNVEYYLKPLFDDGKAITIISVTPTHNDAIMMLFLGVILTFIVEILVIFIATLIV